MSKFKRNTHGWQFNEGGRWLTACKMKSYGEDGFLYRLWIHGAEFLFTTGKTSGPRFRFNYRRTLFFKRNR